MTEARARLNALPTLYPRLFPNGPLPWGFEHGDGWSPLISMLCARLDAILQTCPGACLNVLQVKEKFGTLRFYYELSGASDEVADAIDEAVELATAASASLCERCGCKGVTVQKNSKGWFSNVCADCRSAV